MRRHIMTRMSGGALFEDYFDRVTDMPDDELTDDIKQDGSQFKHMVIVSYIVGFASWQLRALAPHLEPSLDKIVNRLRYIFSNTSGITDF